jgi:hypothetical protein
LFCKILVVKTLWTPSKAVFQVNEFPYRIGGKWFAAQMNAQSFKNRDVACDAAPFIQHPQVANGCCESVI